MAKRTYLTRLASDETEQRAYHRRHCTIKATLYYMRRGVTGYAFQPAVVVNISETGCLIRVELPNQVKDHFYLVMNGIKAKFPCAVVSRTENGIHTVFQSNIPTKTVERLVGRSISSGHISHTA